MLRILLVRKYDVAMLSNDGIKNLVVDLRDLQPAIFRRINMWGSQELDNLTANDVHQPALMSSATSKAEYGCGTTERV